MLVNLLIRNYVLIRELEIGFNNGFSVVTGETGAGKSIILGALNLIMGQRADSSAVFDDAQKCVVEGTFDITNYGLADFFSRNQLDYEPLSLLRREITSNGKSRAFINDTPVTLNVLKDLSQYLIDIHSQHQNLLLDQGDFQMSVLDGFAENQSFLSEYKKIYTSYKQVERDLEETRIQSEKALSDLDYFQFQFDQLEQSNLASDEQETLEEEQKTQSHAVEIQTSLQKVDAYLNGGDENIISSLIELKNSLAGVSAYHALCSDLEKRIASVIIELKDVASEAEIAASDVEFDPQRLVFIQERLNTIYELQQKHHCSTVDELIALQDDLALRIEGIQAFDDKITALEKEKSRVEKALMDCAMTISERRAKATSKLEKETVGLLAGLGMPNACFKCRLSASDNFTKSGRDHIVFEFSANAGGQLMPLTKVASGGEKSRLMLVAKSLLAQKKKLPSILFDEIDTGISGAIAVRMGEIMKQMGDIMQVISITHLPQVAAKGTWHYQVVKTESKNNTTTSIQQLDENMRLEELAKMLGAGLVSDASIKNARELMLHTSKN